MLLEHQLAGPVDTHPTGPKVAVTAGTTPARTVAWLPGVALALAIPLPLASLPPFAFGYWESAEPLQVWLHATAALASLAVAALLLVEPARVLRVLRHPVVLATAAIGLWSVLAAPAVPLPRLSVLGTVQSGLGALWFLDTAVFIVCALLVAEQPRQWRMLAWETVAVVAVVAAIKASDYLTHQPKLIYVSAYYGWLGIYLPFLARWWRAERAPFLAMAALAVAAAAVATSLSLTAVILLGGVVALPAMGRLTATRLSATVIILAAAVAPYLAVRLWGEAASSASLHDRFHLQQMMQAALQSDPSLLFGHGWGRTQDAFHAFLNVTGENLWRPTWIFLTSDYFNAHNWLLETLYAAGVPGVLLTVAAALALALTATRADRAAAVALATAGLLFTGIWFQLCLSLPLLALATAAVSSPIAATSPSGRRPAAVLLVLLALVQAWAAGSLFRFGEAVTAMRHGLAAGIAVAVPADPRGSDLAAAEVIRDAFLDFARRGRQPGTAAEAGAMLGYLDRRIPLTGTTQLPVIGLGVLSQIHFSGELAWLAPASPPAESEWQPWLDRLLILAPGRTDVAIPYLTRLATAGRVDEVAALAARLRARNEDDPVGLYFAGLAEVLKPDSAAKRVGIDLLRRSAAAGIERFMPLDPAVVAAIGRGRPAQ